MKRVPRSRLHSAWSWLAPFAFALLVVAPVAAQENQKAATNPRLEVYGFVMMDAIQEWGQNNPDWFDVMRPTKLPAYDNQFGEDNHTWFGVRQTRFGVKSFLPTSVGEVFTQFEWELFGVGVDAGQTTIRLRHAYGELGHFGAGQYWSPFMDIDVFPNSIEYWGPTGMAFFRNVQLRYMPLKGDSRITFAVERPGASADGGVFADRIELQNVKGRFALPDFSAEGRYGAKWGYVELAGILRPMKWDDLLPNDNIDLNGDALGWGLSLSSNLKWSKATFRFQAVGGEGIENYMNDAPVDVAIETNPGNTVRPVEGKPLPMLGLTGFVDLQWSKLFSTSLGYSRIDIDNTDGQADDAFRTGQYALVNLLYYPTTNFMVGGEVQWGQRRNFNDGFTVDNWRFQVSARVNYSMKFWEDTKASE